MKTTDKPARDNVTRTLAAALIPILIVLGLAIAFAGCAGDAGAAMSAPSTDKPATAGVSGSAGSDGAAGSAGSAGTSGAAGAGGSSAPAEVVASECPSSPPTGTCSIVLVCRYGSGVYGEGPSGSGTYVCIPGSFWDGDPSASAIVDAQRTVDARDARAAASKADAAKTDADQALAVDLAMCDNVTEAQALANCHGGYTTVTACSASVMCGIAKDYQTARDADAAASAADAKAASY